MIAGANYPTQTPRFLVVGEPPANAYPMHLATREILEDAHWEPQGTGPARWLECVSKAPLSFQGKLFRKMLRRDEGEAAPREARALEAAPGPCHGITRPPSA